MIMIKDGKLLSFLNKAKIGFIDFEKLIISFFEVVLQNLIISSIEVVLLEKPIFGFIEVVL